MQLSRICKWSVMLLAICYFVGLLAGCVKDAPDPASAHTSDPAPDPTSDPAPDSVPDPASAPNESIPPADETESNDRLSKIDTDFGTLYIPQKYEQDLQAEISNGDGRVTVTFSAEQDGKKYTLFNINIGKGAGQLAGTLTDKNGTSREVYVTVYDLGDISKLPPDKQDQLYAMQEAVNVIFENLK